MFKNYSTIVENSKPVILRKIKEKRGKVVVFDVDDTLVDKDFNPIEPVVNFYKWCKQQGLTPVIITARAGIPENIHFTIVSLDKLEITGYDHIYFRKIEQNDVYTFKKNCRRDVNNNIGPVIASVGDMFWDVGEYGGYPVLLR